MSSMTESDIMPDEAPKFHLPKKYNKETQVEEHQPLVIEIPYSGKPAPRITWMKDGKVIEETETITTEITEDIVRLIISDTRAHDSGQYSILAQNDKGQDQAKIGVRVLSTPIPP